MHSPFHCFVDCTSSVAFFVLVRHFVNYEGQYGKSALYIRSLGILDLLLRFSLSSLVSLSTAASFCSSSLKLSAVNPTSDSKPPVSLVFSSSSNPRIFSLVIFSAVAGVFGFLLLDHAARLRISSVLLMRERDQALFFFAERAVFETNLRPFLEVSWIFFEVRSEL